MAFEREQGKECEAILLACHFRSAGLPGSLTVAPILPLTVMTIAMSVFPRTHAPMASFQLSPTAIMEEATSQFDTAQASAIQYETYANQLHVLREGGVGSKSAFDALGVAAKLEGSWSTARLKPQRFLALDT